MAKVTRYEDLIAWQKGMALIRPAYLAARVATAQEFHQFLSVAKGSAAEVRTLFRVAADLGYLPSAESAAALRQSEEVGRLLGGLRAAVGRQREIKKP
jgi:four helix bundle protein